MTQAMILQLAKDALTVALLIGAPVLISGLIIGVLVSVFQAVTQIQEMTLSFVPKLLGVSAVGVALGPWMLNTMAAYTTNLLTSLPNFAR